MNYNEEIAKLQKKLNRSFDNRERALLSDKIKKLINERDSDKYSDAKKVKPTPVVIKKEDKVEDKPAEDKVVEPVKEEPKKEKDKVEKVEIVKENNKYDKKKDKKRYSQGPSAIKDNTNPVIVDSRHSGTASVTI